MVQKEYPPKKPCQIHCIVRAIFTEREKKKKKRELQYYI